MNRLDNLPNTKLSMIDGQEFVSETIGSLRELSEMGKPQTLVELEARINAYFDFCAERNLRPGIEALALALSVTRTTLWLWCRGENCSREWSEVCTHARQLIVAFLEAANMAGKINPASAIFALKNWANYSDTVQYEIVPRQANNTLTANELPTLGMSNAVSTLSGASVSINGAELPFLEAENE